MDKNLNIISSLVNDVIITPLKIVNVQGGDVLHGMKFNDPGYYGFGEAYFSSVHSGTIKAWKRHREMTLNLVVPVGSIRFVVYDDRDNSSTKGVYQEVCLNRDNYCRLTIPPHVWLGFQGVDEMTSILLNIANIEHYSEESDRKKIDEIKYTWESNK